MDEKQFPSSGKIQVTGNGMDINVGGEQSDRQFSGAGSNRSQDDVIIEAEVIEESKND